MTLGRGVVSGHGLGSGKREVGSGKWEMGSGKKKTYGKGIA